MKWVAPGGIFKFLILILNLVLPEGIITKGRYCPIFESGLFPQKSLCSIKSGWLFKFNSKIPVIIPAFLFWSKNDILVEKIVWEINRKYIKPLKKNFKWKRWLIISL